MPSGGVAEPGTLSSRHRLHRAIKLLRAAGYELRGQRLINLKSNMPLTFEILINAKRQARLLLPYVQALEGIGVTFTIRQVDSSEYESRLKTGEYDMVQAFWASSLSPGFEQWNRWGSRSADDPGQRNYAGVKNPAVDAMIEAMVSARDAAQFRSAVRAYDRVLRSGDYVIPLFYPPKIWIAHWSHLQGPAVTPNSGFDLDSWWSAKAQ